MVEPKSERFELRLDPDTINRIDEWRGEQADLPSRSEAVRRLVNSGLGKPEDLQLFQLMRFQILAAAKTEVLGGSMSKGYIFAWDAGVYPLFDDGAESHVPFANQFRIPREMVEELSKHLDDCWLKKKVPTFYQLEDYYGVRLGRSSWDRAKLINTCRYMFLKDLFDGQFWKTLLTAMDHPTEASSITRKFSVEDDVYLN